MDPVDIFLRLRIAVASLGEKSPTAWWTSSFLSDTGIRYLAYAFPRAPEIAAIQGAVEAARRLHDNRIGTVGVMHLFRQSYEVELLLLDRLKASGADLHTNIEKFFINQTECRNVLIAIAGSAELGHEGPIQIGACTGLPSAQAMKRLAAVYLGAFDNKKMTFPYLLSPA
jgi:hypothetical protein